MCEFFHTFVRLNWIMISKLRQILIISLLLLFSLENVANVAIDVSLDKYSTKDLLTADKENHTALSWILEEKENEERNDDKVHHGPANLAFTSQFASFFPKISKSSLKTFPSPGSAGNQQLLKLIGRLRI